MTAHAVSRGRLAALVGKRFLAGGLSVYFAWIHCLTLVCINFTRTQDRDYVLYSRLAILPASIAHARAVTVAMRGRLKRPLDAH